MNDNKGLSLLEVLIAMLVLGIGILGLAPMVVLSIEGNNISRDVVTVSNIAKEKLEYLESLDDMPAMPYLEQELNIYSGYDRTTYVRDNTIDTLLPPDVYRVDVTVSWIDKASVQRSTTYSTFMNKG
ncbi:MAG: prepilin-type N-terminal cleavage/methylation domain-containing protein [candidate division Zixibacteria bacterium]|nr:prepilin-type N-terminal cleavage/methylation domain-containing protein [candidate division Zixibacteria bacterium]